MAKERSEIERVVPALSIQNPTHNHITRLGRPPTALSPFHFRKRPLKTAAGTEHPLAQEIRTKTVLVFYWREHSWD